MESHLTTRERNFNWRTSPLFGLPDLKAFLTGFYLQDYMMLLPKLVTMLCTFGCDACVQYTLIILGVMMNILGFVYFQPSITFLACCLSYSVSIPTFLKNNQKKLHFPGSTTVVKLIQHIKKPQKWKNKQYAA